MVSAQQVIWTVSAVKIGFSTWIGKGEYERAHA